jgi:hypothetical protein
MNIVVGAAHVNGFRQLYSPLCLLKGLAHAKRDESYVQRSILVNGMGTRHCETHQRTGMGNGPRTEGGRVKRLEIY